VTAPTRFATALLLLVSASCAHRPAAPPPAAAEIDGTRVDITYVLGHSQRRFLAQAEKDAPRAQLYLEKSILEEGAVDRARYSAYLEKVSRFLSEGGRAPAAQGCRSPFRIELRVGGQTRTLQGCRAGDDGALARLIRDGEFLLYSQR
jgi:hypothetical protein